MPASAVAAIATSPPLRKPRPTEVPPAGLASGARFVAAAFSGAAALGADFRAVALRDFDADRDADFDGAGAGDFAVFAALAVVAPALAVAGFVPLADLLGALRVAAALRGAAGLRLADGFRVDPAPRRAGVLGGVVPLEGGEGGGGGVGGVVSSVISAP